MGDRGPTKQSTAKNKRKGNPGKRKPPVSENRAAALNKLPSAPKYLNRIAGCEWRRIGKEYLSTGKLTATNLKALEAYCVNYATWRMALAVVEEDGHTKAAPTGYMMPHPEIAIGNKAQKEMRDWLKVLDKTPAQRVEKNDPLTEFLDQGSMLRRVK